MEELVSGYAFDEMKANENLAIDLLQNKPKQDALREKARELAANIPAGKAGLDALGQTAKILATILLAGNRHLS